MLSQSPIRDKYLKSQNSDLFGALDYPSFSKKMDNLNIIVEQQNNLGSVWLGNFEAASSLETLRRHKISAVITICMQSIPSEVRQQLLLHHHYYAEDVEYQNIQQYFDSSYDFIEKARKVTNVLIHCQAGISRSATLMIAYLMRKNQIGVKQAIEQVQTRRWQIYPNNGFLRQLADNEKKLFQKDRVASVEEKVQRNVYSSTASDFYRKKDNSFELDYKLNRTSVDRVNKLKFSLDPSGFGDLQKQHKILNTQSDEKKPQLNGRLQLNSAEYQQLRSKYLKGDVLKPSVKPIRLFDKLDGGNGNLSGKSIFDHSTLKKKNWDNIYQKDSLFQKHDYLDFGQKPISATREIKQQNGYHRSNAESLADKLRFEEQFEKLRFLTSPILYFLEKMMFKILR